MGVSKNFVELIGRIGQIETRKGQNGKNFVTLSVATDESYKNDQGQKVEQTEWHRVVLFGQPAKFAHEYLGKGWLVLVEGKLRTRKWKDKEGRDQYTTEVVGKKIMALQKPSSSSPEEDDDGFAF